MKSTVISRKELAALSEYSCSLPTGTTIGKRWRRDVNAYRADRRGAPPEWVIGEYVDIHDPKNVGIAWAWAVDAQHNLHRGSLQ